MGPASLSADERTRLLDAAREARAQAYAPYSHFRVGAAVLTGKGQIFAGANVENASYGLTVCAERVAIFTAAAQEGGADLQIRALAVVGDQPGPCPPCGACLQVLLEFGPQAVILYQGVEGLEEARLGELLPRGFRLPPVQV
jgi:cytidine deaminase